MQFPIVIGLQRSTLLVILLFVVHAVAAGCLVILLWPPMLRGILLLVVGVSLGFALRPPRIIGLRLAARDRLECLLADGERVAATALADSTVFTRLIVIRLSLGEKTRVSSLVLLPDQMSAQQFRVLRLWLRWHAEPKEDAGSVF